MRVIDKINEVHLIIQRDVVAKTVEANGNDHPATRREREALARLETEGVRGIGGDAALLHLTFSGVSGRQGRTAQYLHFETPVGGVNYFPYAKNRPFITIGN